MPAQPEQPKDATTFMFTVQPGTETYTFLSDENPPVIMTQLKRHVGDEPPELLGSSEPIQRIQLGKAAILGVNVDDDFYFLRTPRVTFFGPATKNFQGPFI